MVDQEADLEVDQVQEQVQLSQLSLPVLQVMDQEAGPEVFLEVGLLALSEADLVVLLVANRLLHLAVAAGAHQEVGVVLEYRQHQPLWLPKAQLRVHRHQNSPQPPLGSALSGNWLQ